MLQELELGDDRGAADLTELQHRRSPNPPGDPIGSVANVLGSHGHELGYNHSHTLSGRVDPSTFGRAKRTIPRRCELAGPGVRSGGGTPRFAVKGEGAYLEDADGNRYVDLCQSGRLFGHGRKEIVDAAAEAAARGTSFGVPTEGEVLLAERIVAMVPSVDQVRLVSSGTEAAMSAIRLARAATGRDAIVKLEGCYHGHSDALLARAGSGLATFGIPSTPGVTAGAARDTLIAPFNDLDELDSLLEANEVAALIVEPVPANMGVVPPVDGYLEGLRCSATSTTRC